MSKRKIDKRTKNPKNNAGSRFISPRDSMLSSLNLKRAERKNKEDKKLIELINEGVFDVEEYLNYKYVSEFAREIDWSPGRLNKALSRFITMAKSIQPTKEK